MTVPEISGLTGPASTPSEVAPARHRLQRLAITSAFGDALHPRTWSGAPRNLADAIGALGIRVDSINPVTSRPRLLYYAALHMLSGKGLVARTETILRGAPARRRRARLIGRRLAALGIDRILHTGSFDLPVAPGDTADHYLYCDDTWNLLTKFLPAGNHLTGRAIAEFEALEAASYADMRHIFTFGQHVRDNLIDHYKVPSERITVVGSGMGPIEPYHGPKDYGRGHLLFVAKHLFRYKGGPLLLEAFARARRHRPDLQLVVVANQRDIQPAERDDGVRVLNSVPWYVLQGLYRSASLLVQPMLNDPWGQVYLEALASRTPVLGLNRKGLPEIIDGGRHGFLVAEPDAELLSQAILDAMSDPDRLAAMGLSGQRRVVEKYSWQNVAAAIVRTIELE